MLSRFGIEASQAAQYVIAFVIILILVALFGLVLRRLTGGRLMLPGQDRGRARQPRLGIVDIYDLDRQRQLILLRRDNVEHLLLIGGPNDVVIETSIVRVAGGRLPSVPSEQERQEPGFDRAPEFPARPQIEPNARPSLESQIAARLNDLVARPPERSDADQELTAIGTLAGPAPARVEPPLRPDAITMTNSPGPRSGRSEPAPQAAPRQAPVPPPESSPARTEARPTPPPLRPVTPPRPMTTPEPVRPAPQRPATAPQSQSASQDAAILTDMAKQLEEALKRPAGANPAEAQAPAPRNPLHQPRVHSAPDRSDVDGEAELAATPPAPSRPAPPERLFPPRPTPEPARPQPSRPEAVRSEPVRSEPVRPEPPRPEPARPDLRPVPGPEPVRAEPPRPAAEPARQEPARQEPGRQDAARQDAVRQEPGRQEPGRQEPGRQELGREPGGSRPDTPRPLAAPTAPPVPPPAPAMPPAQPAVPARAAEPPKRVVDDPFSVEEIEAEFARLLGRPAEKGE